MSKLLVKASKNKRDISPVELLPLISGDWRISGKKINKIEKLLVASGGFYLGKYLVVGYEKLTSGKYKLLLEMDPECNEITGIPCPYKNQYIKYI